jgi:hypothetical protein
MAEGCEPGSEVIKRNHDALCRKPIEQTANINACTTQENAFNNLNFEP